MSYVKALQYGDAATARAACTGTEEEMRWVDAMAAMIRGLRDINSALYAHFGPVSSQMHVDLEESIRTLADEPVELFENGVVQANDLQVKIIPQHKGFTSKFQTPLVVSKIKNVWKVDLEQTYLHMPSPETSVQMNQQQRDKYMKRQISKMDESMKPYQQAGEAFSSVAKEVRAHRYKTQDAVSRAISERVANP